jgi:hypothetical protein
LFPFSYTNYQQTNVNLYLELLGSRNLGWSAEKGFVDLAPSVQFIFSSTGKLNLGYRFQISGDVKRLANQSFMLSYEHIFLNALPKKKRAAALIGAPLLATTFSNVHSSKAVAKRQ